MSPSWEMSSSFQREGPIRSNKTKQLAVHSEFVPLYRLLLKFLFRQTTLHITVFFVVYHITIL